MAGFSRRAGLGALIGLVATRAQANDHGPIRAEAGWSRAAGAGRVGAGYLTLRNTGAADRLVAARAAIAGTVELHTHIHENGVMRMRPVEAIDLPAGGTVTLQPGGLHLMLIDLKQPLRQGETVPVTLVFEKAGEVQAQLAVQSAGARGPAGAMPGGPMPGGPMPGGAHRH
ncbi:copper chaperone PCu(A)C [Falsiroseomonas sp.]|uniref:copper chaperone PCu(A)C n=1 Tax=Falsiroseomonas sp. TaxID=2870721 RepID=UPI002735BAEB|nr:copper chaperone PCu(A)C [Falsiroseomonas sp.]MDP3417694.1 copper chaperone PCu(A)C [Falsiroseomonas sp.]